MTRSAQEVGETLAQPELANDGTGRGERPQPVRVISVPASSLQSFRGMFGTLLEVLGTIGIVIVLVIFFLIRREDLRDRFIHLMGKGHVTLTTQMLEDANSRVRRSSLTHRVTMASLRSRPHVIDQSRVSPRANGADCRWIFGGE